MTKMVKDSLMDEIACIQNHFAEIMSVINAIKPEETLSQIPFDAIPVIPPVTKTVEVEKPDTGLSALVEVQKTPMEILQEKYARARESRPLAIEDK